MAGPSSDYHRGEMDITEQASTFHLIMGMTKWGSLVLAAFLLWMVIWFCTPYGFLTGFIWFAIVMVAGVLVLREKKSPGH